MTSPGPSAEDAAEDADEVALVTGMQTALDDLLAALEVRDVGPDRFAVASEPGRFARTFGGQTVAQAMVAAALTVEGKAVRSLHACFVAAGRPGEAVEMEVERVRDGRSVATRRVTVVQGDRTLLTALLSYDAATGPAELAAPAPDAPPPEHVPRLQHWVRDLPPAIEQHARAWVETPPPIELRIAEPPCFLGAPRSTAPRSHWMRTAGPVGDDAVRHAALLAYASDFFLLDAALRAHPDPTTVDPVAMVSLDHAIWFHQAPRADRWHLHTMETSAIAGERSLVRGVLHDEDGVHVASVAQDTLIRTGGSP